MLLTHITPVKRFGPKRDINATRLLKRILVLIGVENCVQLRPALRQAAELQLIDVEAWLRREDHAR